MSRLIILLLVMQLCAIPYAVAQQKNYIFRTSDRQEKISALGIITVPAYVMIDNQKHNGLYVASKPSTSLGQSMKLAPGQVLLTIDGYSMTSAAAADSWLARRGQKPISYSYALLQGSKPFILTGQIQAAFDTSSGLVASNSGDQGRPGQKFSQEELERYCFDLINQSRRAEGVAPVQRDSALTQLARRYSDYMETHRDVYAPTAGRSPHTDLEGRKPADRAAQAGITTVVLENIGRATRGFFISDKKIVYDLHSDMMAEPKGQINHRSTIMDPKCRLLGIGITRSQDSFYLTEEFSY